MVVSQPASDKTSILVRLCASMLQTLGTPVPPAPAAKPLEVARALRQDFLASQRLLEPALAPLQEEYALDDEAMAKAAALAAGALIHRFAARMEPAVAFGYAAYGFTEGARTVPLQLRPRPAAP